MTVIKNRDVPGGKEFWDHVENVAANFQPPEIKSDSIGGRGMMTAEQLEKEWMAQDRILDFRNWLVAQLIESRGKVATLLTIARNDAAATTTMRKQRNDA